jgi:septum site-determining protein MinC
MMKTTEIEPVSIQIKGIKEGLLINVGEGNWVDAEQALLSHIDQKGDFFKGAKVALDLGNHIVRAADMGRLRDKLSDKGISLWAIMSHSPTTNQTSQMLGLATKISSPRPERVVRTMDTNVGGENAIVVAKTLRSGYKVAYNGHVVIMGDVNPGAEISATGNIIVWGRIRGSVHAGMNGDESAKICALELAPLQLRIGELIGDLPKKKGKTQPSIARIENGQVVVETWKQ